MNLKITMTLIFAMIFQTENRCLIKFVPYKSEETTKIFETVKSTKNINFILRYILNPTSNELKTTTTVTKVLQQLTSVQNEIKTLSKLSSSQEFTTTTTFSTTSEESSEEILNNNNSNEQKSSHITQPSFFYLDEKTSKFDTTKPDEKTSSILQNILSSTPIKLITYTISDSIDKLQTTTTTSILTLNQINQGTTTESMHYSSIYSSEDFKTTTISLLMLKETDNPNSSFEIKNTIHQETTNHFDTTTSILSSTQIFATSSLSIISTNIQSIVIDDTTHQLDDYKTLSLPIQVQPTVTNKFIYPIPKVEKIITTTQQPYRFVQCTLGLKKSILFGTSFSDSTSFSITTLQINGITIYYTKNYVNAIKFNLLTGQELLFGNINGNDDETTYIDLVNKQIIAMNIRFDAVINSVQFLIQDLLTKKYEWTLEIGNSFEGTLSSVDGPTYAPNATSFQITSFSGSYTKKAIVNLVIGYKYEQCTPFFNIPTLPPLPGNPTYSHKNISTTTTPLFFTYFV
jgi:hypothetical protein